MGRLRSQPPLENRHTLLATQEKKQSRQFKRLCSGKRGAKGTRIPWYSLLKEKVRWAIPHQSTLSPKG